MIGARRWGAQITGGVTQNELLLSQAVADAIFYFTFYDGLTVTTSVTGGLITDSMALSGVSGLNVLDLTTSVVPGTD